MERSRRRHVLLHGALLLGALLALGDATSAAAADDLDMHPLLTGGMIHMSGSVNRTAHQVVDDPDTTFHSESDQSGALVFDGLVLFSGNYALPPTTDQVNTAGFPFDVINGHRVGPTSLTFDEHHTWSYDPACSPGPCSGSGTCHDVIDPLESVGSFHIDPDDPQLVAFGAWTDLPLQNNGCDSSGDALWYGDDKPGEHQLRLPSEPYDGEMPYVDRTTDEGRDICYPDDCSLVRHQTGSTRIVATCALCFTAVTFEQHDLPSGAWAPVPATGTYDGNEVRVTFTVHNAYDGALDERVRLHDATTSRDLAQVQGSAKLERIAVPAGGTKTFSMSWDTSGLAWKPGASEDPHRIEVLTALGGARRGIVINPRPVFLLHGFKSDAATWKGFPERLEAARPGWDGFAVTGMNTDPWHGNSIAQNAQIAWNRIEKTREATEAQHVDIVGHSMGGLIGRQILHKDQQVLADGTPAVTHLVQLGTPNRGSKCAGIAIEVGGGTPSFELDPAFVEGTFNRLITNRRGTKLSVLAGNIDEHAANLPWFYCGLETPNDGVVGRSSAWWTITDRAEQVGLLHTDMTSDDAAFAQWVKPHLTDAAEAFAAMRRSSHRAAAHPAPGVTIDAGPQADQVIKRKISGATTIPFATRATGTLAVAVVARRGTQLRLVSPSGTVVDTETVGDGAIATFLTAKRAKGGSWKLQVTSPGAQQLGFIVQTDAARALRATLRATPSGARAIHVVATFPAGRRDGSLRLTGSSTGSLIDDGRHGDGRAHDGVFAGTIGMSASQARWMLRATGAGGSTTASVVATRR